MRVADRVARPVRQTAGAAAARRGIAARELPQGEEGMELRVFDRNLEAFGARLAHRIVDRVRPLRRLRPAERPGRVVGRAAGALDQASDAVRDRSHRGRARPRGPRARAPAPARARARSASRGPATRRPRRARRARRARPSPREPTGALPPTGSAGLRESTPRAVPGRATNRAPSPAGRKGVSRRALPRSPPRRSRGASVRPGSRLRAAVPRGCRAPRRRPSGLLRRVGDAPRRPSSGEIQDGSALRPAELLMGATMRPGPAGGNASGTEGSPATASGRRTVTGRAAQGTQGSRPLRPSGGEAGPDSRATGSAASRPSGGLRTPR